MKTKQLMLTIALVAVAMTAACSDKNETASDSAASAPAAQASATTSATQPQAAAPAPSERAQAEPANQQQLVAVQSPTPDADGLIRVHFDDVFTVTADGNLSPKVPVDINGVQMTPGVVFGGGVQFGGFAMRQAAGHDLGVRATRQILQLIVHDSGTERARVESQTLNADSLRGHSTARAIAFS
jgi:hypothetical protein